MSGAKQIKERKRMHYFIIFCSLRSCQQYWTRPEARPIFASRRLPVSQTRMPCSIDFNTCVCAISKCALVYLYDFSTPQTTQFTEIFHGYNSIKLVYGPPIVVN